MPYVIVSWTGRVLFDGRQFGTFLEGWDFIYENDPEPDKDDPRWADGWYDDYYVDPVETA